MKSVFIELPLFERHRADYLDDDAFRGLQNLLMKDPEAGDLMPGTGGLRKLRFADARRGKGKRGGLRIVRVPNIVKRVMRCHDFGSGLEESPAA